MLRDSLSFSDDDEFLLCFRNPRRVPFRRLLLMARVSFAVVPAAAATPPALPLLLGLDCSVPEDILDDRIAILLRFSWSAESPIDNSVRIDCEPLTPFSE